MGERFHMGIRSVPLVKKYDYVTGHWSLGYLTAEELGPFLIRLRKCLLKDRPEDEPGIAIFKETITNEG